MFYTITQLTKKENVLKHPHFSEAAKLFIWTLSKRKDIQTRIFIRYRKENNQTKNILYFWLKKGKKTIWIAPRRGFFNPKPNCELALYKYLTYQVLSAFNFPVPQFIKIDRKNFLKKINQITFSDPWVIKPTAGAQGHGVIVKIQNFNQLKQTSQELLKKYPALIIEKFISGENFRLLVLENKILGAVKRIPAQIKGDGQHTIKELIDISNQKERYNKPPDFQPYLKTLKIDSEMKFCLQSQNLSLKSIPEKDKIIRLRNNANFSTGGEAIDVTDKVHPETVQIAIQAVKALGLKIGGVDLITPDISQSLLKIKGVINEINSVPSLWIHHFPHQGQPREVTNEILNYLFKIYE